MLQQVIVFLDDSVFIASEKTSTTQHETLPGVFLTSFSLLADALSCKSVSWRVMPIDKHFSVVPTDEQVDEILSCNLFYLTETDESKSLWTYARQHGVTICWFGKDRPPIKEAVLDFTGFQLLEVILRLSAASLRPQISVKDVAESIRRNVSLSNESTYVHEAWSYSCRLAQQISDAYSPDCILLFGFPTYSLENFEEPLLENKSAVELAPTPEFIHEFSDWATHWAFSIPASVRHKFEHIDELRHDVQLSIEDFQPYSVDGMWICNICVDARTSLEVGTLNPIPDFDETCARCTLTRLKLRTVLTGFLDLDILIVTSHALKVRDDIIRDFSALFDDNVALYDRDLATLLRKDAIVLADIFTCEPSELIQKLRLIGSRNEVAISVFNTWNPPGKSKIRLQDSIPASCLVLEDRSGITKELSLARSVLAKQWPDILLELKQVSPYLSALYSDKEVIDRVNRRMEFWAK